jgi:hypothetical protein
VTTAEALADTLRRLALVAPSTTTAAVALAVIEKLRPLVEHPA